MKRLWLGLATSLLAAFGLPVVAWAQQDRDFYGPHMMWGGWYGMFMGPLMMIIFIAVVVVLVVLAVRLARQRSWREPAFVTDQDPARYPEGTLRPWRD